MHQWAMVCTRENPTLEFLGLVLLLRLQGCRLPDMNVAFAVQQKVAQLRRLVADGVAKEKKDLFMLAGGDQIAESHANVGKRELRRCNLLFNDSKDTIDHRNLLAAHYLNNKPGLERVLKALVILRTKACEACMVPSDAFKKALGQT